MKRAQSQERTRASIVESATMLFLRDGFKVTSLEQIGEAAGFTRGAVYSNFASKTAMGIAVIDGLYSDAEARLESELHGTDGVADWLGVAMTIADKTVGDPAWTRLEIEIAAACAHDASYRAATAARYTRLRAHWAELLTQRFGAALADPELVAGMLLAIVLGAGTQRAADPEVPVMRWIEQLMALLVRE